MGKKEREVREEGKAIREIKTIAVVKGCPLCGKTVMPSVYGGYAAYGCGEWEAEGECGCGLSFNVGPYEHPLEALKAWFVAWDRREVCTERT